jgi:hypothetical protein
MLVYIIQCTGMLSTVIQLRKPHNDSRAWWCTPAFGRLRQKYLDSEAVLAYIARYFLRKRI